jgi:hypothetical protein
VRHLEDLARDRQRSLLAAADGERDASHAVRPGHTSQQAARASRRQLRSQISLLRADLKKLESVTVPMNLESAGEPH